MNASINPIRPGKEPYQVVKEEKKINIVIDTQIKLYEPFDSEVRTNIQADLKDIKDTFFNNQEIEGVTVKIAGDETHYTGKVALFLDFQLKGNSQLVRLVYKPRSIKPDKIVEEVRIKFDIKHHPRLMLDKENHGYDLFIPGESLKYLTISESKNRPEVNRKLILENLLNINNPKHLALVQALCALGIEDLHAGNFLYDSEKDELHFIDAECYQTGVCLNLNDLLGKLGISNDFTGQCDKERKTLEEQPTRLVFCATQTYINHFNRHSIPEEPIYFIEEEKIFSYIPLQEPSNRSERFPGQPKPEWTLEKKKI